MTVQLSFIAPEPLSRTIDPLPAKCQCGSKTGTFLFLGGNVVGLLCAECGKRLAPDGVVVAGFGQKWPVLQRS